MNVFEHMTLCAELELDLETMYAVLRGTYPESDIADALDRMPRPVLDNWRDTLRLVEMPRGKKKY